MRIIEFITSLDLACGGTSRCLPSMCIGIKKIGVDCNVVTYQSDSPNIEKLLSNEVKITLIPKESNVVNQLLSSNIFKNESFDNAIVHLQGLWSYKLYNVSRFLQKHHIPYIWSPHGTLEPSALAQKKFKKKLALFLYQREKLEGAVCIHATALSEAMSIRSLGFKNPIAIIPNGIDMENYPLKTIYPNKSLKTLLFLSRLHPLKGLEMLFNVWISLPIEIISSWKLVIVGDGDNEYPLEFFKSMVEGKCNGRNITFLGPKYGREKVECIHKSDLFILPTYSENFGVSIAEAMACGVPVITTTGAPWKIIQDEEVGWWVEPTPEAIANALKEALVTPTEVLKEKGVRSRRIIKENFSLDSVSLKYKQMYSWVEGNEDKTPEFIMM